jgi:predicted CoA-substrate-specific enzyme activase
MITAGVDVGTRFLKVCIVESGVMLGSACHQMNGDFKRRYKEAFSEALQAAGANAGTRLKPGSVKKIIATGFGAHLVKKATSALAEASCIARGVHELDPRVRTVIDAGGLFIRVIAIDENGSLEQCHMNEKCAAGSGKFLEMISDAINVPFESITEYASQSRDPFHLTNSCAVFAESDVISHLNSGRAAADILAGVIDSIAAKTVTLLESAGAEDLIAIAGGLSRVEAFVESLKKRSGREIVPVSIDPQMLPAFGGAIIAQTPPEQ